jgi:hypothetical protein
LVGAASAARVGAGLDNYGQTTRADQRGHGKGG